MGCLWGGGGGGGGELQFNRAAFFWTSDPCLNMPKLCCAPGGPSMREVIAKTGTVKAEPHMDAKLKTKKQCPEQHGLFGSGALLGHYSGTWFVPSEVQRKQIYRL